MRRGAAVVWLSVLGVFGGATESLSADGWGRWQPYAPIRDEGAVCDRAADAFALGPAPPGRGIQDDDFADLFATHVLEWRAGGPGDGGLKSLFGDEAKETLHHRFFASLETLCRAFGAADAHQQERLTGAMSSSVRHYCSEWWRWRLGNGTPRPRPDFPVYDFPDYRVVMREVMRLPVAERKALADVLYDHLAWNHEQESPDVQMDHLKAMVAYLPWVPMLLEGDDRNGMIGRAASYYDRMITCGQTFSADGAIIHHRIWHYDYATYSLTQFLTNVATWHRVGLFLSATARSRLRTAALVAATLSDNAPRAVPFNVQGRSGGMPRIGGMTDQLLQTAALLGSDDAADTAWSPAVEVLQAFAAQSPEAIPDSKEASPRNPLFGVRAVNRGGALLVRRPGWLLTVGGLSPLTGKHEIYTWLQNNNYSIFVRRGGMTLIADASNAREPDLGYPLEGGFDWSMIPGATTEPRQAEQLFTRRHNTFITNSGMAAACSLGDAGAWALDQEVGPGPSFRKSVHVMAGRVTCVLTNGRPDNPRISRPRVDGIPSSAIDAVPVTTLFQWPSPMPSPVGGSIGDAKPVVHRHGNGSLSLRDRHGHAYVIHPGSQGKLRTARKDQTHVLMVDRYLREGISSPIDWKKWTVRGKPLDTADLHTIAGDYVPRKGSFDLAWIDHRRGSDKITAGPAATIYSVLPCADEAEAIAFADTLAGDAAAVEVMAANDAQHVIRDTVCNVTTAAIFAADAHLPSRLPIRAASRPCVIAMAPTGSGLNLAVMPGDPSHAEPLALTMDAAYRGDATVGDLTATGDRLMLRTEGILPWQGVIERAE